MEVWGTSLLSVGIGLIVTIIATAYHLGSKISDLSGAIKLLRGECILKHKAVDAEFKRVHYRIDDIKYPSDGDVETRQE